MGLISASRVRLRPGACGHFLFHAGQMQPCSQGGALLWAGESPAPGGTLWDVCGGLRGAPVPRASAELARELQPLGQLTPPTP